MAINYRKATSTRLVVRKASLWSLYPWSLLTTRPADPSTAPGVAARLPLRRGIGVYGVKRVYQGRRGIRGKGGISSSRGYRGYAPASGVNGVNAHQKGIRGMWGMWGIWGIWGICGKAAKAQKECQADSINSWLVLRWPPPGGLPQRPADVPGNKRGTLPRGGGGGRRWRWP